MQQLSEAPFLIGSLCGNFIVSVCFSSCLVNQCCDIMREHDPNKEEKEHKICFPRKWCWRRKKGASYLENNASLFAGEKGTRMSTRKQRSTLLLPRVINVKFPLHNHQIYNIIQYEELGFSFLTQMKDDYTTNSRYFTYTFLFKRLGECTFRTWE